VPCAWEISCAALGVAGFAFDEAGKEIIDEGR